MVTSRSRLADSDSNPSNLSAYAMEMFTTEETNKQNHSIHAQKQRQQKKIQKKKIKNIKMKYFCSILNKNKKVH